MGEEAEYFSKDFEWEELKNEIENNSSHSHHFLSFQTPTPLSSSSLSPSLDSDAWKSFYNRHSTGKFFKERRYLLKEFPELLHCGQHAKLLEVGCGNGSTVLPILRGPWFIIEIYGVGAYPVDMDRLGSIDCGINESSLWRIPGNQSVNVYACDCSSEALERAKEVIGTSDQVSIKQRFHPFVCDFSQNGFPKWLICGSCQKSSSNTPNDCKAGFQLISRTEKVDELYSLRQGQCCVGGMDFITLIFTLSAVPLQRMSTALVECFSVLKPGGLLLFRDYGLYDMTMLRFEQNKRVGFREYMRSDGTRSYYFSLDAVRELFLGVGFCELELDYCCVKSVNRRKGKTLHRVWVHGKFQKPM